MRDAVETFAARGGNVEFFGGNDRLGADARPGRVRRADHAQLVEHLLLRS